MGFDSFRSNNSAPIVPLPEPTWAELQASAQASQSYDQWYQQALLDADRNGGEGGTVIYPDQYYNNVSFTLPGQEGQWQWDEAHNQYIQPEGGQWNPAGITNVNVLHDNGTGNQDGTGIYEGQIEIDNSPHGFTGFVEKAMPIVTTAMIAAIAGGTIGPWLSSLGAEAGAGAGAAAGEGTAAATGATAEAAPAFTYGQSSPWSWSQAGGTELGTGFYGTDPGSMAAMYGTTAGGATGAPGSALGMGLAADGGVWAGAGGGWGGLAGGAADMIGTGMTTSQMLQTAQDVYKYGNNAYKLYNALNPPAQGGAGAAGGPSGGFAGYAGTQGTGGLAQALAAAAGVKTSVPGEAEYTDMTSEIGQIPMVGLQQSAMPMPNNTLPQGKGDAMISGLGKFPYL